MKNRLTPDTDLLSQIQGIDQKGLLLLMEKYDRDLFRYIYGKTRCAENAQEAVQDIFISLWNNRYAINIVDSLSPYLYKAAKHKAIDFYTTSSKEIMHYEASLPEYNQEFASSPDESMFAIQLETRFSQEVDKMPDTLKNVFQLSRQDQLPIKDIAQKFSLSEQTVKNNLTLAVKRLQVRFKRIEGITLLLLVAKALSSFNVLNDVCEDSSRRTINVMLKNKRLGKYNGWGYYQPTKELYDAFGPSDTRREVTILKSGDKFMFFGTETVYSSVNSVSGYQFNKYMEPFTYANPVGSHISANGDHPTADLNVPLLRYAEILLIKAEAALMQGKNADAEINMVLRCAGLLQPLQNATMANLKKERRCELAGEWADRHRDLVRWGDAQAAYAQPLHGFNGSVIWPPSTFNPAVHHVWAVPQKEIDRSSGVIKQNAGW
jgi:RNA polymerase sigma factor (sigma-70 family)